MSASRPSLRDHLVASLSSLPNATPLHLTVLSSRHRRTDALFPHASNVPKCSEREYFVTVGTDINPPPAPEQPSQTSTTTSIFASPPGGSVPTPAAVSASTSPASRSVLITALHAYLYTIPSTSTSILYISKVDTSGYATHALPVTRDLLTSFLEFFLDPGTRPSEVVLVTLFARSQGQYLFPNSVKSGGKRVAGGLGLCQWWRNVFERVAVRLHDGPAGKATVDMRFLLPSYSEAEARGMLGRGKGLPEGMEWKYAPPFPTNLFDRSPTDRPPREDEAQKSGSDAHGRATLAWSIPSLPDDPKSRFLDELVLTHLPHLAEDPARKTSERESRGREPEIKGSGDQEGPPAGGGAQPHMQENFQRAKNREQSKLGRKEGDRRRAQAALSRTSPEEFWERMGFRQECMSGDVTGFFFLGAAAVVVAPDGDGAEGGPSLENDQIESSSLRDRVPPENHTGAKKPPADGPFDLPIPLIDRIHLALLNTDFENLKEAQDGTDRWLNSTRAIVTDEIGTQGWDAMTATIAPKEGAEGGGGKRAAEQVTVLQPRKKARKEGEGVNMLQPRRR